MALMEFTVRTAERGVARATDESPEFLPSVPTIRNACKAEQLHSIGPAWEENSRKQLQARAELDAYDGAEPAAHRRSVVDRLWPKGATIGNPIKKAPPAFRQFTDDELKSLYSPKR